MRFVTSCQKQLKRWHSCSIFYVLHFVVDCKEEFQPSAVPFFLGTDSFRRGLVAGLKVVCESVCLPVYFPRAHVWQDVIHHRNFIDGCKVELKKCHLRWKTNQLIQRGQITSNRTQWKVPVNVSLTSEMTMFEVANLSLSLKITLPWTC